MSVLIDEDFAINLVVALVKIKFILVKTAVAICSIELDK